MSAWHDAYLRFETPEQEVEKFTQRLVSAGASSWPRDAAIVDLFCGRGSGIAALERLGFSKLEGVDLSADLLRHYRGDATLHVGDCRALPFADASKDVATIHGGLHHLERLPEDLDRTLSEVRRILRPDGRLVVVEPWSTPFLRIVHVACGLGFARRLWEKLDALAAMIEHERETYEAWLARPDEILAAFDRHFETVGRRVRFGKLALQARPRGR